MHYTLRLWSIFSENEGFEKVPYTVRPGYSIEVLRTLRLGYTNRVWPREN